MLHKRFAALLFLILDVSQNVRLQVGGLREALDASIVRARVGTISGVNSHVSAQIKVQRESLAAAVEGAAKRLLSRVHQLMALQFG